MFQKVIIIVSCMLGWIIVGAVANASHSDIEQCSLEIKKSLINPETLQVFDTNLAEPSAINTLYADARTERDSARAVLSINCIDTMSMQCLNASSQWTGYIAKRNAIIDGIERLKSSGDFRAYKLRTKAVSKTGNKITSFHLCGVNNTSVWLHEVDG